MILRVKTEQRFDVMLNVGNGNKVIQSETLTRFLTLNNVKEYELTNNNETLKITNGIKDYDSLKITFDNGARFIIDNVVGFTKTI